MFVRFFAAAAIAAAAFVGTAEAQFSGQTHRTTADLNLRAGAGVGFRAIAVIPRGQPVQLYRCNAPVTWCNVNFRGIAGWVSARYLAPPPGFQGPQPIPPIGMPQPVPPFPPPGGPFPPLFPPPGGPFPPFPPPGGPGQPGSVTVSGTLTPEGVQCQALRGQDGRLYTLAGNTGPFRNGDRVRVRGQVAQVSNCMQGTTISVEAIQPWF